MDPDENRRGWATRSGMFSPTYYAELGPNEVTEILVRVLEYYVSSDASILELGCGSGRHLAALRDHGFENLSGIDINDGSFAVMAEHYPALAESGSFHTGPIEDLLPEFPDDSFDVVYSMETLQHVHPDDAWVFEDIVRVTDDFVVTAENEGNSPQRGRGDATVSYVQEEFPLYHRDWNEVFSDLGLAQLLRESTNRDTVRVFRAP